MRKLLPIALLVVFASAVLGTGAASANTASATCNGVSCSDWSNVDVNLHWSFDPDPPDATLGCDDQLFTAEGDVLSECDVMWNPDPSSPFITHVKIDKTDPSVTVTPGRSVDHGTWYNHSVTFHWGGTDALSGLDSSTCTADNVFATQTPSTVLNGSCDDNAGNSDSASVTVHYDSLAPNIGVTPSRSEDHGIWYSAPVTFSWGGTDATSGVDTSTCTPDNVFSTQTASQVVSGGCNDEAGNSDSASTTVHYDSVDPTVSVTPGRVPDNGIWYNHSITFHWGGTDATSLLNTASCTPDNVFTTQTASQVVSGSCQDNAGNSATASTTAHYDSVAPTVSVTPSRAADHGTWYTAPVTFHWSGTDATSGMNSCSPDNVFSTQTTSQSVSGNCSDQAGNSASAATTVHYDSAAPSVSVTPSRPPDIGGATGWYNHSVTFHWSGTDPTSGIDSASCTADNVFSTQTASQVVTGSCADNAGLTASAPKTVKYDSVAPTGVTGSPDRSPDGGGWYGHPFNVVFTGTDATSGISSCAPVAFSGPNTTASGTTVTSTCTDVAGNTSPAAPSINFKYDSTPPTNNGGVLQRGSDVNGWYNHALPIQFSGTGNGPSGLGGCDLTSYTGPDGASVEGHGNCTSTSGVKTSGLSTPFKYDGTPPTVVLSPDRAPDHAGWYTHPVTFTPHGSDATSGLVSCQGGGTYSGPDTAGTGTAATCLDAAGNTGATSVGFRYDATPPAAPKVFSRPGKGVVRVSWSVPHDAASVVVTRTVLGKSTAPDVVYSGSRTTVTDQKLKNGTKYRYTVTDLDAAGNSASANIVAVPTLSSLRPFAETVVPAPPVLKWKKSKTADYYNVQLFRDGKKVWSVWPKTPSLQIKQAWAYVGTRYTFVAGHYRWYVWPGFGRRSSHRYGHVIGQSSFNFGVVP